MKFSVKQIPFTQEELLEMFKYNPETGELSWLKLHTKNQQPMRENTVCSSKNVPGYYRVKILQITYNRVHLV